MHKFVLIWLALGWSTARAQTNPPVFSASWFSVPSLQLREEKAQTTPENPVKSDDPGWSLIPSQQESRSDSAWTNSIGSLTLSAANISPPMTRFDQEIYDRLERGGCFKRQDPPSDNRLERLLNSTFEPEVIHLGKLSVSCSAITAIKRKNPLCLINAIFLRIEW